MLFLKRIQRLQKKVDEDKFDVLFINHVKDDENFYAVVKVDESVHQVIKAQGSKVYIGLSS